MILKHSDISDDFLIFSPIEDVRMIYLLKSKMIKLIYLSLIWCFEWPYYESKYWLKIIRKKFNSQEEQYVEFQNN